MTSDFEEWRKAVIPEGLIVLEWWTDDEFFWAKFVYIDTTNSPGDDRLKLLGLIGLCPEVLIYEADMRKRYEKFRLTREDTIQIPYPGYIKMRKQQ